MLDFSRSCFHYHQTFDDNQSELLTTVELTYYLHILFCYSMTAEENTVIEIFITWENPILIDLLSYQNMMLCYHKRNMRWVWKACID